MMLQMKFDYNWTAGLRDIQVWMCGRTPARVPYYISSSWAFGSGELKMKIAFHKFLIISLLEQ